MKTCPDCGERVYSLGCVNCNEAAYIEEQIMLTEPLYGPEDEWIDDGGDQVRRKDSADGGTVESPK